MRESKEDRELREAIERGEFTIEVDSEAQKERFIQAARNTPRKKRPVAVDVSEVDLIKLKKEAESAGMDYREFIAEVVSKYAHGELRNVI